MEECILAKITLITNKSKSIMLENIPFYVSLSFTLTTFATFFVCYRIIKRSANATIAEWASRIGISLFVWLLAQAVLAFMGVYSDTLNALPPRIVLLGILPLAVCFIALFATPRGRIFIDSLSLEDLTWLHTVRIPVELVLWALFLNKAVPELMTFEGRNFDILAGLTAPIVAYWGIKKGKMPFWALFMWQIVGLALLINIMVNALLSAPSPFQQFAFEMPNRGILYFPFSWLPTFVAPMVLLVHLMSIRLLLLQKSKNKV